MSDPNKMLHDLRSPVTAMNDTPTSASSVTMHCTSIQQTILGIGELELWLRSDLGNQFEINNIAF